MDTRFAHAIHILVFISETTKIASSQALATSINANPSHVRKITGLLKRAGLVDSQQGKSGFILAIPKKEITLADIYKAVYPHKHLFYAHENPNPECPIGQHIHTVLTPTFALAEQQLIDTLKTQTLDDIIHKLYTSAQQ